MWPLLAWLLLYPLAQTADRVLLLRLGGQEQRPTDRQRVGSLAFYLAVAALLATYGFLN